MALVKQLAKRTIRPKKSSGGSIKFKNRDITATKADVRASNGITLVPEGRGIFSRLTVMENLLVGSFVKKYDKKP